MGHLYEKIYHQSLCPSFLSRDREIESLLRAYCRDTISLRNYDVGDNLRDMPPEYFDQAIRCLRRIDTDNSLPDPYPRGDEDDVDPTEPTFPATTPLEKLYCVKRTLELISSAGERFVQENGTAQFGSNERRYLLFLPFPLSLQSHALTPMSIIFRRHDYDRRSDSFAGVRGRAQPKACG